MNAVRKIIGLFLIVFCGLPILSESSGRSD